VQKATAGKEKWREALMKSSEERHLSSKTASDYLKYLVRFEVHVREVQKQQVTPWLPPTWPMVCTFLRSLTKACGGGAKAALKYMFKAHLHAVQDSDWAQQKGRAVQAVDAPNRRKTIVGALENKQIRAWIKKLGEITAADKNSDVLKWRCLYEGALRKQDLVDIPFYGSKTGVVADTIETAAWRQHKSHEMRKASFTLGLWGELKEYRARCHPGSAVDRLFPGLTMSALESSLKRSQERMKEWRHLCPDMAPHNMRHSRITIWDRLGVDIKTIALLVGHGSTRST
jgi:site-specific recombinase XerC